VIHIGYKVPLQIIAPNESYSNIERINSTLGLSITNYDTITLYNDYSIIFQYVFFRREVVEVNKSFLAINTIPQGTNILEHTIDETFYINSQDFIYNSKNIYSLNYALNSRKKNLNSIEIANNIYDSAYRNNLLPQEYIINIQQYVNIIKCIEILLNNISIDISEFSPECVIFAKWLLKYKTEILNNTITLENIHLYNHPFYELLIQE